MPGEISRQYQAPPPRPADPDCSQCGGTGYVVSKQQYATWRETVEYDSWSPCRCTKRL